MFWHLIVKYSFLYKTANITSILGPNGFSDRLAGFFLYVSNTTNTENYRLCFHEIQSENNKPSDDQRINCSFHGRYVIYYNERLPGRSYPGYFSPYAFYELCELEVYGKLIFIMQIFTRENPITDFWTPSTRKVFFFIKVNTNLQLVHTADIKDTPKMFVFLKFWIPYIRFFPRASIFRYVRDSIKIVKITIT